MSLDPNENMMMAELLKDHNQSLMQQNRATRDQQTSPVPHSEKTDGIVLDGEDY